MSADFDPLFRVFLVFGVLPLSGALGFPEPRLGDADLAGVAFALTDF